MDFETNNIVGTLTSNNAGINLILWILKLMDDGINDDDIIPYKFDPMDFET